MRRDPWLDNVKMVLVTLVVFGHALGLALTSDRNIQVYNWLYYFHIPAFVLLSGHLSRNFTWDRRHLTSLATTVALPYLLFEPALWTFKTALGQREDGPLWLQPHWAMWYLCVLFFWRLASPALRHRVALPLSLVVGLAAGLLDTQLLGIPRILGLLPFFVLGLHLDRRHLAWVRDRFPRPLAVAVLLAIFVWAGHTEEWARAAFLYYDTGYADLGYAAGDGVRIRLAVMAIGLLGTVSALALVPRGRSWFSTLGSATLVVYLFHGFVVRYVDYTGWLDGARPDLALVAVAAGSIGLALLLAAPPVSRRLGTLVDPVGRWQTRSLAWRNGTRPLAGQREDGAGDAGRHRSLVDHGAR
jgi:fucose 4-O-acetylase-like acetyltransferase